MLTAGTAIVVAGFRWSAADGCPGRGHHRRSGRNKVMARDRCAVDYQRLGRDLRRSSWECRPAEQCRREALAAPDMGVTLGATTSDAAI